MKAIKYIRHIVITSFSLLLLFSCSKNSEDTEYEIGQNPFWQKEQFKRDYTIQFPATYTGGLIVGFEGNIFNKVNATDSIKFWYSYGNGLYFYDFKDTLFNTDQSSITAVFNGNSVVLSKRIKFTQNGQLIGLLYLNSDAQSYARIFWKDNGYFKESADIKFKQQHLMEVIEVVRTIQRK